MLSRLFAVLVVGVAALTLQSCGQKPKPTKPENIVIAVDRNGSITYNGKGVSCEQLNAIFQTMAKKEKVRFTPTPCYELPKPVPKSN